MGKMNKRYIEWSREEKRKLVVLYKHFRGSMTPVSKCLGPTKSEQVCLRMIKKLSLIGRVKLIKEEAKLRYYESWDERDEARLVKYVKKYERDWKRIQRKFPGKTCLQLSNKFKALSSTCVVNVPLKRPVRYWSSDEIEALKLAYNLYGNDWRMVKKTSGLDREFHAIRHKAASLGLSKK